MGRRKQNKGGADQLDSSDVDSISPTSTAISDLTLAHETENVNSLDFVIERCLDSFDNKSTRLKVLTELVNTFEAHVLLPFLGNKCITLLDQYINSIKKGKGSPAEACLASRGIGLLAMTVGTGSSAKEIMEQSLSHLEKALLSGTDAIKTSVLDCLAIITFVGANNWEETEKSMKIMWDIIYSKSGSKVGPINKPTSAVVAAAVSAWSFLLTTIGGWRIDLDSWMEPISFLYTLLEHDDHSIRIAAGEAIAIIFEKVIADKLSYETTDLDNSDHEHLEPKWFKHLISLKAKIINQVVVLSMEAGGKGTAEKKNLNNQRDLFQKIYKYFMRKECPETSMKISEGHGMLLMSTWTQLIQLNFLKRFLASGFLKHAQENELLHVVFDFTPDRNDDLSAKEKRVNRSSEDKGRTQERNKYRQLAQGMVSPVMKNMLKQSKSRGGRRKAISIRGVPHHAVWVFLRFLYSSCYEQEEMNQYVLHLLVLSHVFVIPSLKKVCMQQLERGLLTTENVIDVFQLAQLCDAPRLYLLCHRLILKSFKVVSATEGWKVMRQSNPKLEKELLESVIDADSRKKERLKKLEERKIYLQLHEAMEALVHICRDGCRTIGPHDKVLKRSAGPCNFPACKGLESLVRHFAGCKNRVLGGCTHCKRMWQLLELHSRLCTQTDECKVPLCSHFKDRTRHQNRKDEVKWKLLVSKVLEAKSLAEAPSCLPSMVLVSAKVL